jgi:type IV pilus assembly protein PilV
MNRRLAVDKSVRRKNRGFTLLEILVALLVLSIGLLGLAGLQTFSLRNNHSAFLRSQAVVLAYDALDRLRSNRDQAMLGTGSAYNTSYSEAASSYSSTGCASNCTSSAVATYDLAAWKADVERLPAGQAQISIDANNKATVQVQWSDNRDGNVLTIAVETLL